MSTLNIVIMPGKLWAGTILLESRSEEEAGKVRINPNDKKPKEK